MKKYPWQRWPDKDKNKKKKSQFHGQDKESSWKHSSLEQLRQYRSRKKLHVKKVDSLPDGNIGYNYYAAQKAGYDYPYPKNVILVKKGMSKEETERTVRHEEREVYLEERGLSHEEAHRIAEEKD